MYKPKNVMECFILEERVLANYFQDNDVLADEKVFNSETDAVRVMFLRNEERLIGLMLILRCLLSVESVFPSVVILFVFVVAFAFGGKKIMMGIIGDAGGDGDCALPFLCIKNVQWVLSERLTVVRSTLVIHPSFMM